MMGRTHLFLGAASLWLLAPVPGALTPQTIVPLGALAAFGALLPDLDAAESTVKSLRIGSIRPFAPLSVLAYRAWGHRGLLHSPIGLMLFALVCVPIGLLWGAWPALALWLGYASHLAGDASTRTGIPAWPNRADRRWWLLPRPLRIITGTSEEEIVFSLAVIATLLLILSRLPLRS